MILGIDPGTAVTGWGIIREAGGILEPVDFGCIRPKASLKLSNRYLILFESVGELLNKFKPASLAIETQFVKDFPESILKLGMARGVIVLAATKAAIPVFEYAPTEIKKAVTGRGQASKHQVQAMIASLLSLQTLPEPEDAADALACAICHHHRSRFNLVLKGEL